MFKVVINYSTPMPQEYFFIRKDQAIEFAKKYHDSVNNFAEIDVYEESTLDDHIDAWLHNYFNIKFSKIHHIDAEVPADDYLPF